MNAPQISVCIPMYNAALFIKDCIDSILVQSFQDFEVLVVDDGSTDNSCEIVNAIDDQRIRLIRNKHDYVGSLNLLLDEAKGKYIARMDADDVMVPRRLGIQYDFMEKHKNIDVVGGQMNAFRQSPNEMLYNLKVKSGNVCISDLLDGCCICHPTVMFRSECLNGTEKVRYSKRMEYAEDYDLWMRLLAVGKRFYNLEDVLAHYRLHDNQVTARHQKEQIRNSTLIREWALNKQIELERKAFDEFVFIPESSNKLTVVMPFNNEGEEVANTVMSIRETEGMNVDIIVINDDSDDGFSYEDALDGLGVIYIKNTYRLGAALSKERGAKLTKTPYFLLLDAHMRFYESGWADYIIRELDSNPQRLLCSKSICLQKDDSGNVSIHPDSCSPHGAYLSFDSKKYVPAIDWNGYAECLPNCLENQIPCVLGAGYATSRIYWEKIKGLQGLVHYGCEEAYISIKAWKEGGGCFLLPNLSIGHIYRKKFPYQVYSFQHTYNYILISELLFPTSARCFAKAVAWKINKDIFYKAMEYMSMRKEENKALALYYQKLKANDFGYVKKINDICRKVAQRSIRISDNEAAESINYILEKNPSISANGLFSGMTGILIAMLHYAHVGHEDVENPIYDIWERISKTLQHTHDLTFQNGLSGIGWALIYAASHGLIEDSIENELSIIDQKIMSMSVKRNLDCSFLEGVGGIYCYVVARLGFDKRNNKLNDTLSVDFLQELDSETKRILKKSDDWRTMNFVSQYSEYPSDNWEILPPEFSEIVDLPDYVPKSRENWDLSLSGIIGSIINKLTNEYHAKNEKEYL